MPPDSGWVGSDKDTQPVIGGSRLSAYVRAGVAAVTLAGTSEVECSGTARGVVGSEQSGRVESITIASCRPIKVCENVETVRPEHLPWQTELTEKSVQVRDTIREVSGEPGWSVTCKTLLGSKTDVCETEAGKEGSTAETNEATHGYVLGEFGPTAKADCTEGGKGSGEVGGIVKTESLGGKGLKINIGWIELAPGPWEIPAGFTGTFFPKFEGKGNSGTLKVSISDPAEFKEEPTGTPCKGNSYAAGKSCEIAIKCTTSGKTAKLDVTPPLFSLVFGNDRTLKCK
jgi:hypothetical protein